MHAKTNNTFWHERAIIFFVGLLVRIGFGYIFYGSSDVDAFIKITDRALNGTWLSAPLYLTLGGCTFPIIPFYSWIGGYIHVVTHLPVAFCVKIIPIFFDVLLAVLIYDFVLHITTKYAFRVGLLYALSPVAIITVCIHGQWESLSLFLFVLCLYIRECYTDSYAKYFLYGSLFTLSFLVKPLSLMFILFFFLPWAGMRKTLGKLWNIVILGALSVGMLLVTGFIIFKTCRWLTMDDIMRVLYTPWVLILISLISLLGVFWLYRESSKLVLTQSPKQYLVYQSTAVGGALCMLTLCFGAFFWYGINCIKIFDNLFRYGNTGVQVCGLPFAFPFDQQPIVWFLTNRFILIVLLSIVAIFYYRSRIDIFKTVILSLGLAFGLFGVSPQYMIWILPFLLFAGFYKISAVYNLILTSFFLFFYMNPFINPEYLYLMAMSFSTLKKYAYLMPPSWLADVALLLWVHILGNYIAPLFFLGIAWYVIKYQAHEKIAILFRRQNPLKLGYVWIFTILTLIITACIFTVDRSRFTEFSQALNGRYDAFCTIIKDGYIIGDYGVFNICNGVTILLLLGIIWSIYSARMGRHENQNS